MLELGLYLCLDLSVMRIISLYEGLQEIAQYEIESWADGHLVTLGRSESTDWSFPTHDELSRHHLSIRKLGNELYVRDEQSSNGTFAEDSPLTHPVCMRAEVSYQVGHLTMILEGAPESAPCEHIDCSSVFPEPYAFAADMTYAPTPAAQAEPLTSLEPEPVEEPLISLEPEPVEEPLISLEPEPVAQITPTPTRKSTTPTSLQAGYVKPFLPIAGAPKTGVPRDFEFQIRTYDGSNQITIGDKLILQVFSSEPCQVLIFCREERGATSMLYPNKQQISQNIPANEWTLIPNPENPHFEFIIEGPESSDEIQAIARRVTDNRIRRGTKKTASNQKKPATLWSHASLVIHTYEA